MRIQSVNPATGETVREYDTLGAKEVRGVIDATHRAYLDWRKSGFATRARLMREAARMLRAHASEYARLMAREMGKPVRDGRAEVEKCGTVCEYYADHAEAFLQREMVETGARRSFVAFQPIGVVLAVMPWNFPFWQVIRFAAPALMAGNVGVLKHASNVPGCALAIEALFRDAGFPDDVFRALLVSSKQVNAIIRNRKICAVTLTGSTQAGKAVARQAGAVLKKTVLELGGSDAYVILEDVDLEAAVNACMSSRLINSGQSCIAAKRFVVVASRRAEFESRMVERMRVVEPGDPCAEETEIGPLARVDLRDELHAQVTASVDRGARCLLGGMIPAGPGAYYPPTVLTDVGKGMPAYGEELFGPVAAIIPVKNERQALRVANDSVFGLGAAVFTRDLERGERIATTDLEAGSCFVNDFVRSDPRLPFGGIKESGYGRELSHFGIREFVNIKTVFVR